MPSNDGKETLSRANAHRRSTPTLPSTPGNINNAKMAKRTRSSSLVVDTKMLTHDEIREMMAKEGTPEGTASKYFFFLSFLLPYIGSLRMNVYIYIYIYAYVNMYVYHVISIRILIIIRINDNVHSNHDIILLQ